MKDQVLNYPFEKWISYVVYVIESAAYGDLLHVTREFHSIKLISRILYALFLRVEKAYTANQNGVQLFLQVDV